MTQDQKKTRQKKASLLEVRQLDANTYLVQSQNDPSFFYKVVLNGSNSCHCADFKKHHEADLAWTCKHITAALDLKAQVERVETHLAGANGTGKLSPSECVGLLYGPKPTPTNGYRTPAKAPKGVPEAPETPCGRCGEMVPLAEAQAHLGAHLEQEQSGDAPQEEPLDPCMECGALLPADEMIPHQSAEGSGLICRDCAEEEAQSMGECMRAAARERLARDMCGEQVPTLATAPYISSLADRIAHINDLLSSWEPRALEVDHAGRTGYGVQWTLDAMNHALGRWLAV